MEQAKTIRSFTLYFTEKEEFEKAMEVAESQEWQAGYIILREWEPGEFGIVEFCWDDITLDSLSDFLDAITITE